MINVYTIYICDDDALFASSLCAKVQQLFPSSFQISVFHSIRTLQAAAEKTPPNIALLDIQLGQDNGISLAKQLFPSPSQTQVIFITGYIEYCSDVYETEHIYFLLKPLDPVLLKKIPAKGSGPAGGTAHHPLHPDQGRGVFSPPDRHFIHREPHAKIEHPYPQKHVCRLWLPLFATPGDPAKDGPVSQKFSGQSQACPSDPYTVKQLQ